MTAVSGNAHPARAMDRRSRWSRREIFRAGAAACTLMATACAPARSLPANAGARANGALTPRPTDPTTQSVVSRTPAPAVAQLTATPATAEPMFAPAPLPTTAVAQGRTYVTFPATSGTVRFAHGWDGPRKPLMEAMMVAFNEAYPHIELEADAVEAKGLRDWLVTAIASGSPPHAAMLRSDTTAYLAEQRAILSLDDLIVRDRVEADWFAPRELPPRTWDGRLYGLPHVAAGAEQLLFVNTGLLDRLGRDPTEPISTWQQLEALIEPARRAGALVMDPTRCGAGILGLQVWVYANGGRWIDDAGKRVTWADPAPLEAAAWLQRFVAAQRDTAGLTTVGESQDAPLSVQEWAAEKHLCCINDAGWIYQLRELAPQLRFTVHELPRNLSNSSSDGRSPTFGGWMLVIPRDAGDPAAAWEWLKFATVSSAATQFAANLGLPSLLATPQGADMQPASIPYEAVIARSLEHSVLAPGLPISAQLDDIARRAQAEAIAQRRPPQPTLETATLAAQRVLDDWQSKRRRP